ncbi:alpha/beta-hydrolase [Lepidopterella palustris CBS 459.81]|uniref:Alpha/beta-hydrolase n=1 Tax=Lepidopterella palustris CBS 459.81 TaxID=1314670 RepID=A0A8E2E3L0_9PEZI|nr:alpha/beta-hydrolase [Lepidopterella palustris CBS 459.81]
MTRILCALIQLAAIALAAPLEDRQDLPTLKLPYGTWKAASYNVPADVYVFKNIRFAAPPLGNLRWAKPEPPLIETSIQNGSYGFVCTQSLPLLVSANGSNGLNGTSSGGNCLFLDIYVPSKALKQETKKLPVVVWIYGGGYSAGSKDGLISYGLYDGAGPITASNGNIIVVTFNYRVGVYGFLAGATVENEGIANAGLHDQYAAFEWVNKYISLVGGDPENVSAWGESAGAGSIYWLLTREGGTKDPLFHRAIVQSPAFQDKFDRNGSMEQDFQRFAQLAGCEGQGLACLRAKNASIINAANDAVISDPSAPVVFNPAPDGKYFRQHATLEYAQGHYWTSLDSVIPSHVIDEAELFVNPDITTDEQFDAYLRAVWPPYAVAGGIVSEIEARYPAVNSTHSPYKTEKDRMKAVSAQENFLCSTRALTTAYADKTYNVQFSAGDGTHGSDILPTWWNPYLTLNVLGIPIPFWIVTGNAGVSKAYQSYLVSHAMTGDPNSNRLIFNLPPTIQWPKVGSGGSFTNVLNVTNSGFELITDESYNKTICDFWIGIFTNVTAMGGYAP